MPKLICTVGRTGDHESRTEEYDVAFSTGQETPRRLRVEYQAARAYEINAALDAAVEAAREAMAEASPEQRGPTDEALARFSWRAIQAAKYERGEPVSSTLEY